MAKGKKLPHNHLAEGEVTNHYHAAKGVECVTELPDGTRTFDATKRDVTITHQEHHAIPMPRLEMASGIAREMDHFKEEARRVMD